MFIVEVLMTAFNDDTTVDTQNRSTRYFNTIDDAMSDYNSLYTELTRQARITTLWDVFVISIFGGSELLKMQTIRCGKDK